MSFMCSFDMELILMILEKPFAKLRARAILKYIPKKNGVICDIGCGIEPRFLLDLQGRISEGWGVDKKTTAKIWNNKVQTIKKNLNEKISLPFNENKFDCVTLLASLEHLKFLKESLKEAWRVLKPGGAVMITTPSPIAKSILEFLAFLNLVSKEEIRDHKHYYSKRELINLLRASGFCNIKHHYFELGLNQKVIAKK